MITREEVLLADRFEKDEQAHKAQQAKVHRLEGAGWDEVRKKHEQLVREERGKLHRLAGLMQASGAAKQKLELAVDRDLRLAFESAEADLRLANVRLPDYVGPLNNHKTTLERLKKGGATEKAIAAQKAVVAAAEKEVSALRAEAKRIEARIDAARKAFRAALDAKRKEALEG